MNPEPVINKPEEQFLGEIETVIVGMKHRKAHITGEEHANLEREPENLHNQHAIRVENGRFEQVGYLPRSVASWLAPLLDAGKLRVDSYAPPQPDASTKHRVGSCPLVLMVFLLEEAKDLLEEKETCNPLDTLHEVVRRAYNAAQKYTDPELVLELAKGLQPLEKQELLPETRLLLALLPGMAKELRSAHGMDAIVSVWNQLSRLSIGNPLFHRNLTVFPLFWPNPQQPPYILLSKAIDSGEAVVEEVNESGSVPNLIVTNRACRPILIPEGEILIGAKQNRVVNITVLVAAGARFVLPVSCVEAGRWRYQSRHFEAKFCAPPSLRSKKIRAVQRNRAERGSVESDQGEVWAEVAHCMAGVDAKSETASLTDGFDTLEDKLSQYRQHFPLHKDAAGVIVARGDRIVGMDLFDSPETLATLWPRLSDAYFFDALGNPQAGKQAKQELAQSFINHVGTHMRPRMSALGLGKELEIRNDKLVGVALLYSGSICHLAAFSEGA